MQKSYILPLIILMFLLVPIASAMDAVNVINPPGTGGGNITYNITNVYSQMNQTPNQTPGQSATIVINSTTTLAAGASAFVTNIGTALNAIWDIGIPQGAEGQVGAAGYTPVFGVDYFNGTDATIAVGSTTTGAPNTSASVTNVGIPSAGIFNFVIPQGLHGTNGTDGQSATITINYTATGSPNTPASVSNIGTSLNAIFDFVIPKGDTGLTGNTGANGTAATATANYTFTGLPGTNAIVSNVGTTSDALFDFTIPRGDTGLTGNTGAPGTNGTNGVNGTNGTAASILVNYTFTGIAGSNASVINIGNTTNASFDFTIPTGATGAKGDQGATGGTGGQMLFFRHLKSTDPITYEGLVPKPFGAAEVDENATINDASGKVLIDAYITDVGYPAITTIPAGLWIFRTFGFVSATTGTTTFVFDVYNRTTSGTETLLFSVTTDNILSTSVAEHTTYYAQPSNYYVTSADRIVVKVSAQTTKTGSGITYHWIYEGTTHNSNIQTPISAVTASALSVGMKSGANALYKGQAVYISGATGGVPIVDKADNTIVAKTRVVGLIENDVAANTNVNILRTGVLTGVNTLSTNANINPLGQTWVAGDLLFATSTGGLTNVRPTSGRSVKAAFTLTGSNATDSLLAYPFENPVWTTAAANEGIVLRLGDTAGATMVSVRDYTNYEVMSIESDGDVTMNGILNMTSNLIRNVSDPLEAQDAATKQYVDDNAGSNYNASYLNIDGSVAMTGNLSLGTKNINNLAEPSVSTDAATKNYADSIPIYNSTYDAKLSVEVDPTLSKSTTLIISDFYDPGVGAAVPGLTGLAISTGTAPVVATTANHPGVVAMKDSLAANGGYKYGCVGRNLIGGGETFEMIFQPVGVRSTQGAQLGWSDTTAANTLPVDGVWFNISGNDTAIILKGATSSNSNRAYTASNYVPTTATWYRGTITIASDASLITYTIYNEVGVSQWTDTVNANIPTGAGRDTSPCIIVAESTTDAAANILVLDFVKWASTKTLVR